MDESTIPVWLSLIALASLIQVTIVLATGVVVFRGVRRLQTLATTVQRDQIAPLVARGHRAIDEVQDIVTRVRTYDDEVRGAIERAGDRVHHVTDRVRAGSWPLIGLVRGASAAFSVLVNGRQAASASGTASVRNNERAPRAGGSGHARY